MLQLPLYQPQVNFQKFSLLEMLGSFASFGPELAWLIAGLVGIFFIVTSFILSYHWTRFGFEILVMAKAKLLYYSVSAVLLAVMAISLAVYLSSI